MDRWDRAGRVAAYGSALALVPYLLIKVSWVVGSLLGLTPVGEGFSTAGWVLLNAVTIGMSLVGIGLSLALVRPWGMRIPGWLVAFCAWTGSGFLVSILPYALLSPLLTPGGPGDGDSGSGGGAGLAMPVWEGALLQCSFVGMGLGLAVALPVHLRRRWPDAFSGRAGDLADAGAPWAAIAAAVVGVVWLYWAFGGIWGIAYPAERDTDDYLLTGVGACWALAGAVSAWCLARGRPARLPRRMPVAVGWLGSGSLFAWSGWKLPFTLVVAVAHPGGAVLPENPAVAVVLHLVAVVAGAGMLRTVIRSRARSVASAHC